MSRKFKDYVAESGGWKLDSQKAWDAWEELKDRLGEAEAGEALAQALDYDTLAEMIVYIARENDLDDMESFETESDVEDSKKSTKDAFEANIKKLIKEEDEAIASYEHEIENAQRPEVDKVLRHIQAEEQEHKRELEKLLSLTKDNDEVQITRVPQEEIDRQNAKTTLVTGFISELLSKEDLQFTMESSEYPFIYMDFLELEDMEKAARLLEPYFEKVNSTDDDGFCFISVKSTEYKGE